MKVLFVNTKLKYLFEKDFGDRELLNLLIKINHSPHTPILPLRIYGLNRSVYDYYQYRIAKWFDNLGFKVIPFLDEYLSYPMYHKKKNK